MEEKESAHFAQNDGGYAARSTGDDRAQNVPRGLQSQRSGFSAAGSGAGGLGWLMVERVWTLKRL
jgi:hypothetical protein